MQYLALVTDDDRLEHAIPLQTRAWTEHSPLASTLTLCLRCLAALVDDGLSISSNFADVDSDLVELYGAIVSVHTIYILMDQTYHPVRDIDGRVVCTRQTHDGLRWHNA